MLVVGSMLVAAKHPAVFDDVGKGIATAVLNEFVLEGVRKSARQESLHAY